MENLTEQYKELKILFEKVFHQKISEVDSEDCMLQTVARDLDMYQAYYSGIADKILKRYPLEEEDFRILARPVLIGSKIQNTPKLGSEFDLSGFPKLLEYATVLEEMRNCCMAVVSSQSRGIH